MFFIYREGETIGPYTAEEVRRRLAQGAIAPDDFCWRDGMADWQVISELPIFGERAAAPAPRRTKPRRVVPIVAPPAAKPAMITPAVDAASDRSLGAKIAILVGGILAVYCIAFYPSPPPIDERYARGLEVVLGGSVGSVRLHDRSAGLILAALLLGVGLLLFLRAQRLARSTR